ncbi:MAG: hypothetical protein AB1324_03960 [Candidatus Micrarchaeota archaeon]
MADVMRAALLMAGMKRSQWMEESDMAELQGRRLRELVEYSRAEVPHYKKALGEVKVRDIDDLPSLPLTDKRMVRGMPDSFISRRFEKNSLSKKVTSGSSGIPLTLYSTGAESDYHLALEYQQMTEAGVGPLDLQAHVTYYRLEPHALQRLGLFRRVYLLNSDPEEKNLRALKRLRPGVFHCYPSFLAPLAHVNMRDSIGFTVPRVFSSAEVLSPASRRLITRSFQCDLRDLYGSTETSWIAWQCERGSMHLHSDSIIAEIVDGSGKPVKGGRAGSLVLTPLWKRAMPFIRYSIGDRASFAPACPCGRRGLRVMNPVQGRNDDFIVLRSGRFASARLVEEIVRSAPGVMQYQAIQSEPGELLVRIVPSGKGIPESAKKAIADGLRRSYREEMDIRFEAAGSLPRGGTGKLRSVISKVKPDADT